MLGGIIGIFLADIFNQGLFKAFAFQVRPVSLISDRLLVWVDVQIFCRNNLIELSLRDDIVVVGRILV